MPISFQEIVKPIPEKGRAPEKGFCIYFPLFPANDDWFQIPEAEQERVISRLSEHYPNCAIQALRAALDDYIFPFQKVILVIENGRCCVLLHEVSIDDLGQFTFSPDDFIKQYPSMDSICDGKTNGRFNKDTWLDDLNAARKRQLDEAPNFVMERFKKSKKAQGFASDFEGGN